MMEEEYASMVGLAFTLTVVHHATAPLALLDVPVKKNRTHQSALKDIVRTAAHAKGPQAHLSVCVHLGLLESGVKGTLMNVIGLLVIMVPPVSMV